MIRLYHECTGRSLRPFRGLWLAQSASTARRNSKRHCHVAVKILLFFRTVAFVIMLPLLTNNELSFAVGCPAPSFAAARLFDVGTNPSFVAASDFNGDGKPDLAVVNDSGLSILLGNGDGTFQAKINAQGGGVVAVDDLNRDGKIDVAVAHGGGISVLLGMGDGTLRAATNYATGITPNS